MYQVLFVDDDEALRRWALDCPAWREYGFALKAVAADGVEALKKMEKEEFHLVVTDIHMPNMDGMRLIKEIRRRYPRTAVAIASSYPSFSHAREGMRMGAADFIPKPLTEKKLWEMLELIRTYLEEEDGKHKPAGTELITEEIFFDLYKHIIDGDVILEKKMNSVFFIIEKAGITTGFEAGPLVGWLIGRLWKEMFTDYPWLARFYGKEAENSVEKGRKYLSESGIKGEDWKLTALTWLGKLRNVAEIFQLDRIDKNINRICSFMAEKIDRGDCLEKTAEEMELSRDYMRILFKNAMDMGLNEYLTMMRMEYGKSLLEYTDLKVYEVGIKAGYTTVDYFSRLFKAYTGETPQRYRKREKNAFFQ